MSDIAIAAGISRPGLYLYFKTKEEIFKSAILQQGKNLLEKIKTELVSIPSPQAKILHAFEIWTIKPFEQEISSKVMKEMTAAVMNFAEADFNDLRNQFEILLSEILIVNSNLEQGFTAERYAHLIYSAVRGYKLAATNPMELTQTIKDLLLILDV